MNPCTPCDRRKRFDLLYLVLGIAIGACGTRGASATPPRTVSLDISGETRVGQMAPWFSGWRLGTREVLNRDKLLKSGATRGYVMTVFATWCKPCKRGLRMLADGRTRLAHRGLSVLLVNSELADIEAAELRTWLAAQGHNDTAVLLDRFGATAAAFGAVDRFPGGKGQDKTQVSRERTSYPRTIVLDSTGKVLAVFGIEGPDFVDRILAAVPD